MPNRIPKWSFVKVASLSLLAAALVVFGTSVGVVAQEQAGKEPATGIKKASREAEGADGQAGPAGAAQSNIVSAGYTRPGNPPDRLTKEGTIKQVAFEPDFKGIGGTVYFTVLELTGKEGDSWGTGVANIDSSFVAGLDYDDTHSPRLDTRRKYLYLYQVVNDRSMEPTKGGILLAANTDIDVQPVASTTLRLRVDPRYITSWGYFRNTGFLLKTVHAGVGAEGKGGVAGVKLGGESKPRIVAVSATAAVIKTLPEQMFLFRSPAYQLPDYVGLGRATEGLNNLPHVAELRKKRANNIRLTSAAVNLLKATESAGT
jgi:hypothetical protein